MGSGMFILLTSIVIVRVFIRESEAFFQISGGYHHCMDSSMSYDSNDNVMYVCIIVACGRYMVNYYVIIHASPE